MKKEALKILATMNQAAKVAKYSRVPDYAIPKSKFGDTTANQLTQAIITWLTLNGCWATRISSAGRYLPSQKKFIPSTTRKGTADIHAIIGGRHVSIEVKIGADRMSDDQKKVQQDVEKAGGIYFIARSFDDFMNFYKTIIK